MSQYPDQYVLLCSSLQLPLLFLSFVILAEARIQKNLNQFKTSLWINLPIPDFLFLSVLFSKIFSILSFVSLLWLLKKYHLSLRGKLNIWIPAFAGMTIGVPAREWQRNCRWDDNERTRGNDKKLLLEKWKITKKIKNAKIEKIVETIENNLYLY